MIAEKVVFPEHVVVSITISFFKGFYLTRNGFAT